MGADNFYLVSALPALGDLGSAPPLTLAELREHVSVARRAAALVDAVLLGDDLLGREAAAAGEVDAFEPSVLTAAQARDEEPLPEFLAAEAAPETARAASDAVWAAYYRHAAGTARREGSRFLGAWVAQEVALRNALATARAKALDLEAADYLVAADLGRAGEDFAALVSEWASASTPLEGLRVLDRARWQWLTDHEGWFTFADDELAAYAARLTLATRWHRLSRAAEAKA